MKKPNSKTVRLVSGITCILSLLAALGIQLSKGYFSSISGTPTALDYSLSCARNVAILIFLLSFSVFFFLLLRKKHSVTSSVFMTIMLDSLLSFFGAVAIYIIAEKAIPLSLGMSNIEVIHMALLSIIAMLVSLAVLLLSSAIFAIVKLVIFIKSKITQN